MRQWAQRLEYQGVGAALLAAVLLGSAPILGKLAYAYGVSPLGLAAARTALAALLLWIVYGGFYRQFTFIYAAGLAECALAGAVNGVGSLFYYAGLKSLDASLAQLLYTTYPLFVAILLRLDGERLSRLAVARLLLTLVAIYLLTTNGADPRDLGLSGQTHADLSGVILLLASAIFFALHVVFSQRALYDMPAPTVTLYSLTTMAVTVAVAWLVSALAYWLWPLDFFAGLVGSEPLAAPPPNGLMAIAALGLATALSRLTLFAGVKRLGGVQTTLLSVGELMVALLLAHLLLGDQLATWQWAGAVLLVATQILVGFEHLVAPRPQATWRPQPPPAESVADQ